jgi:hypothetical protein
MAVPPRRILRFICLQYNLNYSVLLVHLVCQNLKGSRQRPITIEMKESRAWYIRGAVRPGHEYMSRVVYISRIRHTRNVIDRSIPKEGAPDY